MRVHSFSSLFVLMSIVFIFAVAAKVFIGNFLKPKSIFDTMVIGALLTGVAALAIDIDIPG